MAIHYEILFVHRALDILAVQGIVVYKAYRIYIQSFTRLEVSPSEWVGRQKVENDLVFSFWMYIHWSYQLPVYL